MPCSILLNAPIFSFTTVGDSVVDGNVSVVSKDSVVVIVLVPAVRIAGPE